MNSQAYQSERWVLVGQEALEAHGVLADFHLGLPKIKNCEKTGMFSQFCIHAKLHSQFGEQDNETVNYHYHIIMIPKILALSPLIPGVPGKPGGPT